MSTHIDWVVKPATVLAGELRVPGDKSISHRALLLNAIATGESHISGLLEGEDCLATLTALRALGVRIDERGPGEYQVHGRGLHGLSAAQGPLDLGNSGTAMRLFAGLLSAQRFASTLTGDASLSRRPMARVLRPLTAMGAAVRGRGNRPPLSIEPVSELASIRYGMPIASAQVKSAILLAGLYARGETLVTEPARSRDHTERLLSAMGAQIETANLRIALQGPGELSPVDIRVPRDLSSAAFFIVAATLCNGSVVHLPGVGVNPTRTGVLDILRDMGATINCANEATVGGEPVADITVRSAPLRGIDVAAERVPLAIDEFPVLFVAAAAAAGVTRFRGIAELRHKESDRIEAMVNGLRSLGVSIEADENSATVTGGAIEGGEVTSLDDHRVAMAFAVAGCVASGPLRIANVRNVDTSFPGFADLASAAGMRLSTVGPA